VRAPRECTPSAVEFCRRFPSAGGRGQAAGIDHLERARIEEFLDAFDTAWSRDAVDLRRAS